MADRANINFRLNFSVNGQSQVIDAGVRVEDVRRALAGAQRQAQQTVDSFTRISMAAGGITQALSGLKSSVSSITESYRSFDSAMRSVNTMAGKDSAGFDALKEQVKGLAATIPIAREQLASGLYQVISNGVPEDNWISYLEASAKASVGGIADLGKTVTVTSTLIKNYALSWDQAGAIQDKIQTTAKNGVTSFEQLADALPKVAGTASQLGVSVDELMASFATLTGVSGNTAEVGTQLSAIFSALTGPSTEAQKMADQMGIKFDAAAVKAAGGMQNFLVSLKSAISEYAKASGVTEQSITKKLFGSVQALNALGPLMGNLSKTYATNIEAMAGSTGTIDAAFTDMARTSESGAARMKNAMAAMTDWIGSVAASTQPFVTYAANAGMAVSGTVALATALKKGYSVIKTWPAAIAGAGRALVAFTSTARGAMIAGGALTLAISAIAATTMYFANKAREANAAQQRMKEIAGQCAASINAEMIQVNKQFEALKKAKKGTEEYNTARNEIMSRWGEYLKNLGDEKTALDDVAAAYDAVRRGVIAAARAKAKDKATEDLTNDYIEKTTTRLKNIKQVLDKRYGDAVDESGKRIADKRFEEVRKTLESGGQINPEWIKGFRGPFYNNTGSMRWRDPAYSLEYYISEYQKATKKYNDAVDDVDKLLGSIGEITTTPPEDDGSGGGGGGGGGGGDENKKTEKTRLQEINAELEKLKNEYIKAGDARKRQIEESIAALNKEKKQIEETNARLDKLGEEKTIDLNLIPTFSDDDLFEEELDDLLKNGAVELDTLGKIDKAISHLRARQQQANAAEIREIQNIISLLERKRKALEGFADSIESEKEALSKFRKEDGSVDSKAAQSLGIDGIENKIAGLNQLKGALKDAKTGDGVADKEIDKEIDKVDELIDKYRELAGKSYSVSSVVKGAWGGLSGTVNSIKSLTESLKENRDAWETIQDVINTVISIYESVSKIIEIVTMLSKVMSVSKKEEAVATQEGAIANTTAAAANVAAAGAEATANTTAAASGAFKAHSKIPFVGIAIAAGMVAAMIATMLSLPKFAKGGIAYGPTLGLFGEYSGASNNPEVVAPLDRLRSILGADRGRQKFEFRIRGRDLETIRNNESARRARTR